MHHLTTTPAPLFPFGQDPLLKRLSSLTQKLPVLIKGVPRQKFFKQALKEELYVHIKKALQDQEPLYSNFKTTDAIIETVAKTFTQKFNPKAPYNQPQSDQPDTRQIGYKIFRCDETHVILVLKPKNGFSASGHYKHLRGAIELELNPKTLAITAKGYVAARTTLTAIPKQIQKLIRREGGLSFNSPYIISNKYCFYYQKGEKIKQILIQKKYSNGDLFEYCKNQINVSTQNKVQIIYDILRGLCRLAERQIVHRDLKLENILIDQNKRAVIADLGFCCEVGDPEEKPHLCGTVTYLPPEAATAFKIEKAKRNFLSLKFDLWSLGCIIHILFRLSNNSPFPYHHKLTQSKYSKNLIATLDQMYEENAVPGFIATKGEQTMRDLATTLLCPNPKDRSTANEALKLFEKIFQKNISAGQLV